MTSKLELRVTGMTCGGCAASVKRALARADAEAEVDVDLASGLVRIDGAITLESARHAIEDAGFGVAIDARPPE
jgi:copper chaperone